MNRRSEEIVFTVLLVVSIVTVITGSVLLYLRRTLHPIKPRQPRLLIFFNLIALSVLIITCVDHISPRGFQCEYVNAYLASLYFSSFPIRAFILWIRFERVQLLLANKKSGNDPLRSPRLPLKYDFPADEASKKEALSDDFDVMTYTDLISPRFIVLYVVVGVIFTLLPIPVFMVIKGCGPEAERLSLYVSTGQNFVLLMLGSILAYKLRKEYDYFWLKAEFLGAFIAAIVSLPLWVFVNRRGQSLGSVSSGIAATIMLLFFFMWSVFIPIAMSYKVQSDTMLMRFVKSKKDGTRLIDDDPVDSDDVDLLNRMLNDPEGLAVYKKFLVGEMSAENILFYKTIHYFIQKMDDNSDVSKKLNTAREICKNFVYSSAKLAINISSRRREQIINDLKVIPEKPKEEALHLLRNVFKEALEDIVNLMASDSFQRFKARPEAQEYFKSKEIFHALHSNQLV